MTKNHDLDLPVLPAMHERKPQSISDSQFTRRKLQGLLHIMTAELKNRGTKTPHIFLPFRSRVDDSKLNLFLRRVFPGGNMVDTTNKAIVRSLLNDFDEFTLICGLKYLWCRLPNNEVIGWPVYLEFKRKEQEAGYPKDAFLTIMPKCLSSSSHASIVYDFLDLMISIASNTQYNHINGRKAAKMASIWAFKSSPVSSSAFYDATLVKDSSFLEGLDAWKKRCNGLFHLLLSFLRAMLPDTEAEALNLPKTLQSLLVSNTYPPPENSSSVKSVITIPCVHIRSTRKSADPYELISKVRHTLSFEKKDAFLSIENFTILKNIFQKPSTAEIVSTLSEESRRVLARLTADPVPSEFDLYPGWAHGSSISQDPNIPLYSEVTITSISLQDYFIWTWLSSLGSDQTENVKSLFGRSIVVEAGLRGFQKWMVLTETSIPPEEYISIFQNPKHKAGVDHYSRSPQISPLPKNIKSVKQMPALPKSNLSVSKLKLQQPLPSTPLPKKNNLPPTPHESPLPDVSFSNDQFSFEDEGFSDYHYEQEKGRNTDFNSVLSKSFSEKMVISSKKPLKRPRPPPLDIPQEETHQLSIKENELPQRRVAEPPVEEAENSSIPRELEEYYLYYAPTSSKEVAKGQYEEPFESYNTAFDLEHHNLSLEPFDNYQIPGENIEKRLKSLAHERSLHPEALEGRHVRRSDNYGYEKQLPPINVSSIHDSNSKPMPKTPDLPGESELITQRVGDQGKNQDNGRNEENVKIEGAYGGEGVPRRDGYLSQTETKSPVETPYPNDLSMQPLFSDGAHENSEGHSPHFDQSPVMPENSRYPFYENSENTKKKKNKLKKKEIAAMLANIPDGPPPPLPSDGEPLVSYDPTVLYGLEKDNKFYHENDAFGLPVEHHGRVGVHNDPNFAYAREPEYLATPSQALGDSKEDNSEPKSEKMKSKDKPCKKPRSPYLQDPEIVQSPYYSPDPSFHQSDQAQSDLPRAEFTTPANIQDAMGSLATSGSDARGHPHYSGNNSPMSGLGLGIEEPLNHKTGNYHSAYYGPDHASPRYDHGDYRGTESRIKPSEYGHLNVPVDKGARSPVEPKYAHVNHTTQPTGKSHLRVPNSGSSSFDIGHTLTQLHTRQHASDRVLRAGPNQEQAFRLKNSAPPLKNETSARWEGAHKDQGHAQPISGLTMPAPYLPPQHAQVTHVPPQHAQVPYMPPQQVLVPPQHVHASQPVTTQHMPQYYYPPPPQAYYPPPPQGYGHPAPVMYYPPPGGYYAPPVQQHAPAPAKAKPSTSELAMMNMPTPNTFKKNSKPSKANLRAALNQGGFGI